jgi:ATP-binding cassette subfamily B multidrug efflux pump
MRPFYRLMQQRIDRISRLVRDQIIGVRVIRAFVRDRGERERFEKASEELFDVSLGAGRTMAYLFPTMMLTVNLSTVAVIWFGGHRIDNGGLQVGALAAFIGYLLQILTAVMVSSLLFVMVPRSEVCAGRIREVLDAEPGTPPPSEPVTPLAPVGELTFDDVEFRYPGAEEPVLRGINLTARVGQITAIVGGTGSGKTTLLSLIPRLFDVTGGSVRIGGVDVRELDPAALSGLVAMVPQQPYLFAGTIASNLRYGRPEATETEIWQALETAQAADFVRELPERLDAPIAQGGSTVSGGQRQRLTIARAILHRPRILLFDDSFSALDYATAAALNSALAQETQDRIVFVVAQRINLIRDADQIVVLDGGRIVATGTHTELIETCETYQEIARSQLTETEVL